MILLKKCFMLKLNLISRMVFGSQVPYATSSHYSTVFSEIFLFREKIPKSLWHRNDWKHGDTDPTQQSFPILNNRFTYVRYVKKGRTIQGDHLNQIGGTTKINI